MILCRLYGDILQENSCEHELQQIENNMDTMMQDLSPEAVNLSIVDKLSKNVSDMVTGIRGLISTQLPTLKANIESATQANAGNPNSVLTMSVCIPNVLENFVDKLVEVYSGLNPADKIKTGSDLVKCMLTVLKGNANLTTDDMAEYIRKIDSQGINGAVSYQDMNNHFENLSAKYGQTISLLENTEVFLNDAKAKGELQESTIAIVNIAMSYITSLVSICTIASTQMTNALNGAGHPLAEYLNECVELNVMLESAMEDANDYTYILTEGTVGDLGKKIWTAIKEFFTKLKTLFKFKVKTNTEKLIVRFEKASKIKKLSIESTGEIPVVIDGLLAPAIHTVIVHLSGTDVSADEIIKALVGNEDLQKGMDEKFVNHVKYTKIDNKLIVDCISDIKSISSGKDLDRSEEYVLRELSAMVRDNKDSMSLFTGVIKRVMSIWMSNISRQVAAYVHIISLVESNPGAKTTDLTDYKTTKVFNQADALLKEIEDFNEKNGFNRPPADASIKERTQADSDALQSRIKRIMAQRAQNNKQGTDDATQREIEQVKAKIAKLNQIKNDNPHSTKEEDDAANKNRANFKVEK
jgi:hypothetical protein